ncbi:nitrite reductase [Dietzia sp. 111N12-1]|nr:nitrite reductase [Dietzia sp. 111N12-1]
MAAARLAEELRVGEPDPQRLSVTVLGAEPEEPYNRIMLSHAVAAPPAGPAGTSAAGPTGTSAAGPTGTSAAGPTAAPPVASAVARLKPAGWWARNHIEVRTSTSVAGIDRATREVELAGGERVAYDHLVLATGAAPRVPPVDGIRGPGGSLAPGAFTLRDAAGQRELTSHLAAHPGPVAVVGAGFIGLEIACALAASGRDVVVVHPRDRPMNACLDVGAGAVLVRALDSLGMRVVTGARATRWDGSTLTLDDGEVRCRTVVLTAGSAPRSDLARDAGLEVGHGVVIDDELTTSDPEISAIGDCAEHRGVASGLVAPAWDQAVVLAARLSGADPDARYLGGTQVTRLKAHGIDVVALGSLAADVYGSRCPDTGAQIEVTTLCEPARGRYARVDVAGGRVVGAALIGHPEPVGMLTQMYEDALPVPDDVVSVVLGRAEAVAAQTPSTMPAAAVVCRCNGVSKGDLVAAWTDGARDHSALSERTRAGTGCGGCSPAVDGICDWLQEAG